MFLQHVNPCDGVAFQAASEEEWINTGFYNLLQNSMGRMWGNKKMAPACIYTTWSGGGRSVSSHFPANSLPFVCCYSIWVIEQILVFNPRHSNVVYSFILKLLKTESKLKAFLIKRLKISTCHLDALNHMFSVLFLISIIGMKCYLFGTFFFPTQCSKLCSLALILIGNTPPDLILCAGTLFLWQWQYSILKSLLYYSRRYNLGSEAFVNIATNCDSFVRVSLCHRFPEAEMHVHVSPAFAEQFSL